ncbi:MAG: phosphoribosylanthranilate isomerase [Clostridia bacterium]|nr:phosphoribosylanthranilate isomerase [Clostridia bacterium]
MTKIKFCGLTRPCDIEAVNELKPEYIGFVFYEKSKRNVTAELAGELKKLLIDEISAVGVFVDSPIEYVASLLNNGIIDIAQLHGSEDEGYIKKLRSFTDKPIIKAFKIKDKTDITEAEKSSADYVLLDSGCGTGSAFDWNLIKDIKRPYFLAGGLNLENIENAVSILAPFAVDVSSGIETNGLKDKNKMREFVCTVRGKEETI